MSVALHLLLLPLLLLLERATASETLIGISGDGFVLLASDTATRQPQVASNLDKIAVFNDLAVAAVGDAADADRLLGILSAYCSIAEYESSTVGSDVRYIDCSRDTGRAVLSGKGNAGLSVECVAHAAREKIASALRSAHPLDVCLLVAGMSRNAEEDDESMTPASILKRQVAAAAHSYTGVQQDATTTAEGSQVSEEQLHPALFWLDPYGALQRVSYGVHAGAASTTLWAVLDRGYTGPNMSLASALELLDECLEQLLARYSFQTPKSKKPQWCIKCVTAHGVRQIQR